MNTAKVCVPFVSFNMDSGREIIRKAEEGTYQKFSCCESTQQPVWQWTSWRLFTCVSITIASHEKATYGRS